MNVKESYVRANRTRSLLELTTQVKKGEIITK